MRMKVSIRVCLSVSDLEQGSSVLPESCFFVQCRLSPCSNLGYLAVISLAHCYSHCCWVGTFSSFSLFLSSPLFIQYTHLLKHLRSRTNQRRSSLSLSKVCAMAERGDVGSSEGMPAADTYPRKILEYMEGFLISKVTHTRYSV